MNCFTQSCPNEMLGVAAGCDPGSFLTMGPRCGKAPRLRLSGAAKVICNHVRSLLEAIGSRIPCDLPRRLSTGLSTTAPRARRQQQQPSHQARMSNTRTIRRDATPDVRTSLEWESAYDARMAARFSAAFARMLFPIGIPRIIRAGWVREWRANGDGHSRSVSHRRNRVA
jgi:hypothetical protein